MSSPPLQMSNVPFTLGTWLNARYHNNEQETADDAVELGGLCLTGKCTYKNSMLRLARFPGLYDRDGRYIRVKWQPTWRLSVEPETENQVGFAHDQLIDNDNLGPVLEEQHEFQKCVPKSDLADHACAICLNPLDWLGFSGIRPTCLECGHIFCTTCIDSHVATRGGGNTCPLCKQVSTKQSQWVPHGEARLWQQRWKQLGEFTN